MQNRLNSIALAAIAENNAQLLSEANSAEIPPISTDDIDTVQSEDEEQACMSMGGVSM